MHNIWVATGLGSKQDQPGCICGSWIGPYEQWRDHTFMREFFMRNPGFGVAGTYTYNFAHWRNDG